MKSFPVFILVLLSLYLSASGQDHSSWWEVEDYAVSYMLPEEWRSDPFSTSSVCDCPGTINDNGEWTDGKYIGMVIYPVSLAEKDSADRQQIWGYGFVPGEEVEKVSYAGIPYTATYGSFLGMKGWPKVWQLVSTGNTGSKFKHLIIYFWSEETSFDDNKATFDTILETFKRSKVK